MAVNFTPNKGLSMPTSGTEIGVWGPEINGNMAIIDNSFGGIVTVSASVSVTLSSAQYQCAFIRLTGALGSNVTVTLPNIASFYTFINDTTNSSAFFVTLATSTGRVIGLPPGTMTDVMTTVPHVRFRGLPPVGTYWDHAGSSTPAWVTGCTAPQPYLYCNGGLFASVTYPQLAALYGSTAATITLPDFRGRSAFNLNDGTSRITSGGGGIDGNTKFAAGGIQTTSLSSIHLPNVSFPVTDPGHTHGQSNDMTHGSQTWNGGANTVSNRNTATLTVNSTTANITVASGGSNATFAVTPPAVVSGIRLVRAA